MAVRSPFIVSSYSRRVWSKIIGAQELFTGLVNDIILPALPSQWIRGQIYVSENSIRASEVEWQRKVLSLDIRYETRQA